jgi:exopolysaccharide biosynthesis polyprenyl glycosylphosphotransferase
MWWRTPWLQQRWMLFGLAVFDGAALVSSYNLLFWHQFQRWAGITGSTTGLVAIWVGTSYLIGRYSRPNPGERDTQIKRLLASALVALIALCIVVVIVNWGLGVEDPRTFRSFVLPVIGGTLAGSSLLQAWLVQKQKKPKHWLIIATTAELEIVQREIRMRPSINKLRLRELKAESTTTLKTQQVSAEGIAVSATADLDDALTEEVLTCRGKGINVTNLPCWCEQNLQRVPPELLSNRWLTNAEGFDLQPGSPTWRLKRMGDLMVGSLILLASAPVMAMAALAIKLEDGGPIFYRQTRSGLYGQPFTIWKLRSMCVDSERHGARWAKQNDNRITRIGTVLRRTRLDELPQLLSVLKGDMSLIGPRPERPEIEGMLENQIAHYRIRHWIRPGLSGWAQVCFPYGASLADSRMKLSYDLFYLRNAGLLLDLLILIKTIKLVCRAQGAVPVQPRK